MFVLQADLIRSTHQKTLGTMILEVALSALLVISYTLDAHSIFIRTQNSPEKQGEFLALANLVQYLARIIVVIAIFSIAILTETNHIKLNYMFIFGSASAAGSALILLLFYNEKFSNMICRVVRPAILLSFNKISNQKYWRPLSFERISRLTISSFAINSFAVSAAYLPFLIAEFLPQFRMTSVYAGQLLNFGATAIVLMIQDPNAMRLLDTGRENTARSSILTGRIASHAVAAMTFVALSLV